MPIQPPPQPADVQAQMLVVGVVFLVLFVVVVLFLHQRVTAATDRAEAEAVQRHIARLSAQYARALQPPTEESTAPRT